MPLLTRKRMILAKIEATYGTDSTPLAANAILVSNLNITPVEQESDTREIIRPSLGDKEIVVALNRVVVEFDCELVGSGSAGTAPGYGALLRACGLSETIVASTSVTYAPVSSSFESATIYIGVDGVQHKVLGARGTFSIDMSAKQIPTIKFKMTGLMGTVTDTALVTPTFTGFGTPLVVNNTNSTGFALHGFSGVMSALSVDLGVDVNHRSLVGASEYIQITNRDVTGQITIEAPTIASKDFFTIAKTAASGALTLTHGTVAGNKCKIDGVKVQISQPQYTDMDGVQMLQMAMNFRPNAAGGNDELTLTYT